MSREEAIEDAREKVRSALERMPYLSQADVARKVGVSRQRVHQIVKDEGLTAKQRSSPRVMVQTSIETEPVSPTVAGTIAEMVAAADLLARGWHVFFPLVRTTHCDLVATDKSGERVIRIEVRSGWRVGGSVKFTLKDETVCDHYAIVLPGEPVIYKPEL